MAVSTNGSNYLQRAPSPSGLAEVLSVILDKGIVIDAFVRVSLIGIELVTIDARIVIASVDTYLRFAEAVNRLDLSETEVKGLPELEEVGAKVYTKHKIGQIEGEIEEKVEPGWRGAAKGAVAGAAVAGAAAVAKHIVDSRRDDRDDDDEDEDEE